jgi:KDO2-lipid IV(A) lauroyltransferase
VAKVRSALRNRVEEAAFDLARRAVASMPQERAEALGRKFGRALRALLRSRRELAERNLTRAFPEKSPAEIEALAIAVFEHFGGLTFDLLKALDEPVEAALARIEVCGLEHPRRAAAKGRGIFFLTSHLGSWEFAALATGAAGFPLSVVARRLDNPLLETRLRTLREKTGNAIIYKADAARELLRLLRRGGAVGILTDQHAHPPQAVVVPFFGRPASTTSVVARLAERTGAVVIPTACLRTGPSRYRLTYGPPVDIGELPPEERAAAPFTARLNRILEGMIREHPEQWLWLHNRWRLDEAEK